MSDIFYKGQSQKLALGDYGFDNLSVGTHNLQDYRIIVASEASEIEVTNKEGDINTITIPQGFNLYGNFKSITVISGSVVAYLGSERKIQ